MALDPVKNFAKVEVSIGYDASATSIVLISGDGAKLPNPSADGDFNLVWWDDTTYKDPADDPNVEIVRCTARSTDTLTVTRNQEGSGASTKNTGGSTYRMIVAMTKKMKDDIGAKFEFGGDGSDGALVITSGATDINLGGLAVVVKQYASISITGSGKLTFSNPNAAGTTIILKSQGDVVLTSSETPMIDASGMGGSGGAGGAAAGNGSNGTNAVGAFDIAAHEGTKGDFGGNASIGGLIFDNKPFFTLNDYQIAQQKGFKIIPGSGGGGAGGGRLVGGGVGGNGGGALIINCGGDLNFTTSNGISVNGKNGVKGTDSNNNNVNHGAGGGGGGGASGMFLMFYNTLTSASGTITTAGGNAGAGGDVSGTAGGGGGEDDNSGEGGSGAGHYGGAGGNGADSQLNAGNNGINGSNAGGTGAGGGGGSGASQAYNDATPFTGGTGGNGGSNHGYLITQNFYF